MIRCVSLLDITKYIIMDNNFTKQVVVARYDEAIYKWLILLGKHPTNITVYNKSDVPILNVVRDYVDEIIDLPNVGRESHTYLQHIVNNYDTLADITVFLQGDPTVHGFKLNMCKYFDIPGSGKFSRFQHASVGVTKSFCDFTDNPDGMYKKIGKFRKYLKTLDRADYTMAHWWRTYISENLPDMDQFRVSWGGCFSVTKDYILTYPKSYYEDLLGTVAWSVDPEQGHFMERAWSYIYRNTTND